MYHSLIGKSSLRVGLVMGLLIGLCLLLLAACGGQKSTSAGSASTDGLIVFRRYLDLELTRSAIFTMYPRAPVIEIEPLPGSRSARRSPRHLMWKSCSVLHR